MQAGTVCSQVPLAREVVDSRRAWIMATVVIVAKAIIKSTTTVKLKPSFLALFLTLRNNKRNFLIILN
ncbi:hypothetical protein A2313_02225 [Candidatus Roizmanbacteria bacterium RIFOXYB2_FULL_41_10]|nr:MAG: hypothetical protein A2262_04305 [Candidatus Roizmanbacteria bacterium RIFOXYA2_FULL_41_8]OGK66772.1 MAG: hypothetical protein A2377_02605 [Candidatus Roizmanbacteria bacterium RIFOXYB1_FULL_41_27]OGK70853.1 MAG: hypothetical protein A2403_02100 [Candidatus Roizmanbacteria bacterium RIFOXYC1_FULL_41_16]OGK71900.1 MAG: hypothetical protein A2313_02225 [Candidatus Roizmanbacteria bacterium RIFOXYB2_FULL_41_10]OGK75567.1 MAG: hypothetical protein A2575_02600 [Candidatus Roizmanbacteria bac